MICPHPEAIEHQGRMAQSALDESQRRQAWRIATPCCWEGLAWLAFLGGGWFGKRIGVICELGFFVGFSCVKIRGKKTP